MNLDVIVSNEGSTPIVLAGDECGILAVMVGQVSVPSEPFGKYWDGTSASFKDYVLKNGLGPGGVPASAPARAVATTTDCQDRPEGATVAAGASERVELSWKAEVVHGIPAPEGDVPYTITVTFDPAGGAGRSGATGPFDGPPVDYQQIVLNGHLHVSGSVKTMVSSGRAVDSVLADERFQAWLAEEPSSTWSTANVFLLGDGSGEGIAPTGASWEVDIFREHDVARTWAIGFVDPFSGELAGLTFCNKPCDR